ncbi:hypothetical protein WMY93_018281 [Mugilogobius chulae]|uniref:Uncharacterized protein n=1 Tax=Mugilogobius chulae TaxID=88201 RepID=A0AAW0NNA1_9GOBI
MCCYRAISVYLHLYHGLSPHAAIQSVFSGLPPRKHGSLLIQSLTHTVSGALTSVFVEWRARRREEQRRKHELFYTQLKHGFTPELHAENGVRSLGSGSPLDTHYTC